MRLALAQLNFTVGAFEANYTRITDAVARASSQRADLVVFTELAATGYPPRDWVTHDGFVDRNLALVDRVAALSTSQMGILIGFVDRHQTVAGKPLRNAVAFCQHGRIVARRHKSLLPTYDVFDEDRYFEPASSVEPITIHGAPVGVSICEDVWNDEDFWPTRRYHRDPIAELTAAGAEIHINLSASPYELAKAGLRRAMIRQEAIKHGRYFFYVNQVGGNDELIFDGHSTGIDPSGEEIVRGPDFEEALLVYDVAIGGSAASAPVLHPVARCDEESAWGALVLGLRDYARKCRFEGVVLGLSGGIDSALTACLAVDALGADRVLTVALPSRYSSAHSLTDAAALAHALGVEHRVISIDTMFQAHLDALAATLPGGARGLTAENLQARIRGAVLMALSNQLGHLLLTTGNKSELAVGYCTLYGDMCGGLALISDVPKTLVYRLARYANRARTIIPESTLTKAPSAELRPDQKDSDSLPPYDVLDRIIEAYVEKSLDVDAIAALGHDRAVVADVVRLIKSSEYKRRQAAPGIKISSKAFGLGRRYPIAAE